MERIVLSKFITRIPRRYSNPVCLEQSKLMNFDEFIWQVVKTLSRGFENGIRPVDLIYGSYYLKVLLRD